MTIPELLYRLIPLTQGQWAAVDAADYDWLMQWKWHAHWNKSAKSYYAASSRLLEKGKRRLVFMHREILGLYAGDKRQGDHIDHDTLNHRRSNLRIATHIESSQNRRLRSDNTLGYKGIFVIRNWCYSRIKVNKEYVRLGRFPNTAEGRVAASEAYQTAAKKYFGEFHCEL